MTLDQVIDALTQLRALCGGGTPVCHHDDWDDFLVEQVTLVPAVPPTDPRSGYPYEIPAYVLIEGQTHSPDGDSPVWPPPVAPPDAV